MTGEVGDSSTGSLLETIVLACLCGATKNASDEVDATETVDG